MAGLHFDITGDNSNFLRRLDEVRSGIRSTSRQIEESGMSIEQMFGKLAKGAAALGVAFSAKEFISNVTRVRGEFQQLEVAFNTMLGSKEKANTLMQQLVKTAATTPFDLQGIANGAKQLLAYGTSAEDVNGTLVRLGDIAAGLSIPLGDLVYLYGTTMSQGRLYTQDLNQFTGRGIPMIGELAKQFGVAESEVKKLVESGKVGFPEVQKVIESLTNEGGKFGGLMEAQSKTITGQISNIEDAIEQIFNEIGKKSEGIISSTLSVTSSVIENWEKIGKALLVVISVYGAYKAAVIAVAAAHKIAAIWGEIQAFLSLTKSVTSAKDAMLLLNMATKANPIGIILGVVAAAAATFGLFSKNTSAAAEMTTKFGEKASTAIARIDTLTMTLKGLTTGSSIHIKVMDELNGILEEYGIQAIKEGDGIDAVNKKRAQAIELIKQEAIERQRANALDQGAQDYAAKLADAQKALYSDLSGAMTNGVLSSSGNEEIQRNSSAISTIIGNAIEQNITNIAGKTGDEYQKGLDKIFKTIQDRMRTIGISEETISKEWLTDNLFNHQNIILKYIGTVHQAKEEHDRYSDAVNKSADAEKAAAEGANTFEEKVAATQRSLQGATDDVHTLYANIKDLMSKYNENTIGFTVKFNAEPPKWMNDKSIPELQHLAKVFSSLGESTPSGGKTVVNGKEWTKQELLQRGADYVQAAENKQVAADDVKRKDEQEKKEREKKAKERAEAAKTLKKEQEKYNLLMDKQALDQSRSAEDLQIQVDQARINAMDEGSKKTLEQMELNFEKEMQAIDRQKEDLLRKEIEDGRAAFESDPKNEKKTFDPTGIVLSDGENKQFDELYKAQIKSFEKDKRKLELESMRDYLKEYGTFQQKKLAIAEEYAEKIKNAQNEWERKSLEEQKNSALSGVDLEAINKKIDWQGVFGDFTGMLESQLKETLSGLKEYVKTDKFKSSPDTDKKTIYDAIERLQSVTPGGEGTLNFSKIQQQMDNLGAAINRAQTAALNQEIAWNNSRKAQEDYDNALKSGDKGAIDNAKQALDLAKLGADAASNAYKSAEVDVQNFGNELGTTGGDTVDGLNAVASGLHGFASGTLPDIFKGLQNTIKGLNKLNIGGAVGDAVGTLSKSLSNAGVIGQIISAILSILDVLKDGIGPLIAGIIDSILGAIDGILENILSGDLFVQIFESIKNGIGSILNTISFGGWDTLMDKISGSNAKEVQEAIDKLTDRNEILGKSIDKLTDVMEKEAGSKAISAYEQAKKYQQETNDNTLQIAQEQARYSGSHHSWQYYMEWTDEQLNWARENVDKNFSGTGSLWGLKPEQMKLLLSNADIYDQIKSEGKGGYGGRVMEKLEAYADQAGKLDELTEKINESIAQISFDSLRDSFVDALMDMDSSAEDFANNFEEYLMRAMLNFSMEDIDAEMKAWYNNWTETIGKQGGTLTEDQIKQYKKEWDDYVHRGIDKRNGLAELTGYDSSNSSSSQSSTQKSFEAMSQDSADELNGRFTALQISNEDIKNSMLSMLTGVNLISTTTAANGITLMEIRNIALLSNSHLEDIARFTKPLLEVGGKLDRIESNTKGLASR